MKNKLNYKKSEILEIILISIVIAFGINFISTGLVEFFEIDNGLILIFFGTIMCLLVIAYYIFTIIKQLNINEIFIGNFIVNGENNRIYGIFEYWSSWVMRDYLNAILLENKTIAKKYNSDMKNVESYCLSFLDLNKSYIKFIIDSLIEYIIISYILSDSIFLTEKNSRILDEKNIPNEILKNIFIKTLSKDYKKRSYFDNEEIDDENDLYSLQTREGYIYSKLEMQIPNCAKIYKKNNNTLIINCKYYELSIKWGLEEAYNAFDCDFYNYYLKDKKINFEKDFSFSYFIDVNVKYKFPILFNRKSDINYEWVNEIIKKLKDSFDYEENLKIKNWDLLKSLRIFLNK